METKETSGPSREEKSLLNTTCSGRATIDLVVTLFECLFSLCLSGVIAVACDVCEMAGERERERERERGSCNNGADRVTS